MQVNKTIGVSTVNFMNFISVLGTSFFLTRFGRKTLMVFFPALMVVAHLVIAVCIWDKPTKDDIVTNYIALVMIVLYVVFFEFSMGPIVWLYNSEILNNKAVSFAATINWVCAIIVSAVTPLVIDKLNGKLFLIFACFVAFHVVFASIFMKETKGLSPEQVQNLYVPNGFEK